MTKQINERSDNLDCADCGASEKGGRHFSQQCAHPVNAGENYLEEARE